MTEYFKGNRREARVLSNLQENAHQAISQLLAEMLQAKRMKRHIQETERLKLPAKNTPSSKVTLQICRRNKALANKGAVQVEMKTKQNKTKPHTHKSTQNSD